MAMPSSPSVLAMHSAQLGCLSATSSLCLSNFQSTVFCSTSLNILAHSKVLRKGRRQFPHPQSVAMNRCRVSAAAPSALLHEVPAPVADVGSRDHSINRAEDEVEVSESPEVGEAERRRRAKISLANKGRMPWNKGRKHSPATIALIKKRSREVMQDPKIREKLRQNSRPQSEETREKLRICMKARMLFERRQFLCVQEWKDSIAETARVGGVGDEELLWDSYKILKQDLRREHVSATKELKKGQKIRAARSWTKEQRLKLSESVRAKWEEDPMYRHKVILGISEFHRRQDQRRSDYEIYLDGEMEKCSTLANTKDFTSKTFDPYSKSTIFMWSGSSDSLSTTAGSCGQTMKSYYDPLVKEKLQRVKELQMQNMSDKEQLLPKRTRGTNHGGSVTVPCKAAREAVAVTNGIELAQRAATERARILLAAAEQAAIVAAKALEAAGTRDGVEFSLRKARTLLDEANLSLVSVGAGTMSP